MGIPGRPGARGTRGTVCMCHGANGLYDFVFCFEFCMGLVQGELREEVGWYHEV